jgi:hypothetical protein
MQSQMEQAFKSCITVGIILLAGMSKAATNSPPEVFAPGVISGPAAEACPAFTPDDNAVYFDVSKRGHATILVSHKRNGQWQKPVLAPFSGVWLDHDAAMAPDGSHMIFVSNRPAQAGGQALAAQVGSRSVPNMGGNLWRVDRRGDGWSEPVRLPDVVNSLTRTYAPSVAGDGSVYFIQPDAGGEFHIYRSQYKDGHYQVPVRQQIGEGAHEMDPAIAADESFVIFNANYGGKDAPDRLYVSFKEDGKWGKPIDLGDEINAGNEPWGAHLSGDQHTLYYTTNRTMPVSYPRTPAQAEQQLSNMRDWDNGEDNIWYVSIEKLLEQHKAAPKG